MRDKHVLGLTGQAADFRIYSKGVGPEWSQAGIGVEVGA